MLLVMLLRLLSQEMLSACGKKPTTTTTQYHGCIAKWLEALHTAQSLRPQYALGDKVGKEKE